jgi:hypothetical protein
VTVSTAQKSGPDLTVRAAIAQWRDELVNLTARNRLLNFKSTRTGSVDLRRPSAAEVLAGITTGNRFSFRSLIPDALSTPALEAGTGSARIPDTSVRRTAQTSADDWPDEEQGVLDSSATSADLSAGLRSLMRKSNQEFLDRGLWVLYLAFGTLVWSEVDGTTYRSPLMLVPVELHNMGPRVLPELSGAEEDTAMNPALTLKLSQSGIDLPQIDDLDDVVLPTLLQQVREAVAGNPPGMSKKP